MDQNNTPEQQLSRRERRELERQRMKENPGQLEKNAERKKLLRRILTISIAAVVVVGIGWLVTRPQPSLPPATGRGHTETMLDAHIMTEPIPEPTQRHMLEHADGTGKPSVIIQYNCEKYICEEGLVDKLTTLVGQYPDNVYLAPNTYDGKIILTREGAREILEEYDEGEIKAFIESSSAMEGRATSTMQ